MEREVAEYAFDTEDVLSYALFPQVAKKFFEEREAKNLNIDLTLLDKEQKIYPV